MNKNNILNNLKNLDDLNIQLREQDTVLYWEIDKKTSNIINTLEKDYDLMTSRNIIHNNLDSILEVVDEVDLFNVVLADKINTIVNSIRQEVE